MMPESGMILVLDADSAIAELITEVLRDEGYTVATTDGTIASLCSMPQLPLALVLLDDTLPPSLAATMQHAWHNERAALAPVVCMTTSNLVASRAAQQPNQPCLLKPFTLEALIGCVATHRYRHN